MMFKPFFIHQNLSDPGRCYFPFRGFTAFVQPSDGFKIKVQITYCSRKDAFCRKSGREVVKKKPIVEINNRHLGSFLGKARLKVYGDREDPMLLTYERNTYDYVYKYML